MPSATTSARQPRNRILLRLYKVRGNNYSDDSTREALQTLSDLYHVPAPCTAKEREADSEEWAEDDHSSIFEEVNNAAGATKMIKVDFKENVPGESAARARKHIQKDVVNKLADGSRQFLQAFGEVDRVCIISLASQSSRLIVAERRN